MKIRHSTIEDLPELMRVYEVARETMRSRGNLTQWTGGYPQAELLMEDIRSGSSYAAEEDGRIVGTFAFFTGDDPTYRVIEGRWLNNRPYGTIHRIGSDNTVPGLLKAAVNAVLPVIRNIRIDTHKDNYAMQHLMDKYGFTYCGVIHLEDGSPRIAYQREFAEGECL